MENDNTISVKTVFNYEYNNLQETYYVPVVGSKKYSYVAETYDIAYIIGLSIKYEGLNGQFTKYACRMLNIKSNWTK